MSLSENDLELIVKNPKAFESFILTLSGKQFLDESTKEIPQWADPKMAQIYFLPLFLSSGKLKKPSQTKV